jgi:hypothetical protein
MALPVAEATPDKYYRTNFLKDFDLPLDMKLPYRVYVLRCRQPAIITAGFAYYVGLIETTYLQERLLKHFTSDGARFTSVNVPIGIELL